MSYLMYLNPADRNNPEAIAAAKEAAKKWNEACERAEESRNSVKRQKHQDIGFQVICPNGEWYWQGPYFYFNSAINSILGIPYTGHVHQPWVYEEVLREAWEKKLLEGYICVPVYMRLRTDYNDKTKRNAWVVACPSGEWHEPRYKREMALQKVFSYHFYEKEFKEKEKLGFKLLKIEIGLTEEGKQILFLKKKPRLKKWKQTMRGDNP